MNDRSLRPSTFLTPASFLLDVIAGCRPQSQIDRVVKGSRVNDRQSIEPFKIPATPGYILLFIPLRSEVAVLADSLLWFSTATVAVANEPF